MQLHFRRPRHREASSLEQVDSVPQLPPAADEFCFESLDSRKCDRAAEDSRLNFHDDKCSSSPVRVPRRMGKSRATNLMDVMMAAGTNPVALGHASVEWRRVSGIHTIRYDGSGRRR